MSTLKFTGVNAFMELTHDGEDDLVDDSRMSIVVSSNGFAGQNDFWILARDLGIFATELHALEQTRRGKATLKGITDELQIVIEAIDLSGHMAIRGKTGYWARGWNKGFFHSVEFGFEFEPSQLVSALAIPWMQRGC